jgi:hypothetical protein
MKKKKEDVSLKGRKRGKNVDDDDDERREGGWWERVKRVVVE